MIELSSSVSDGLIDSTTNDFFFKLFGTTLFITGTVGELISGYNDPLMSLANAFLPSIVNEKKFSLINGVTKRSNNNLHMIILKFYT